MNSDNGVTRFLRSSMPIGLVTVIFLGYLAN
jgi:hypothetical protein